MPSISRTVAENLIETSVSRHDLPSVNAANVQCPIRIARIHWLSGPLYTWTLADSLAAPNGSAYQAVMRQTKVDRELEALETQVADDPERENLILRTRRFKSSWLELAEALTEVHRSGSWQRWGFSSFDDYTRKELHLRPDTVAKLTASFVFLKRKAPSVLRRDGVTDSIPSYKAVDFWRQAESEGRASQDTVEAIRSRVVDEGVNVASLNREFRAQVFHISNEEREQKQNQALKSAVLRLRQLLSESEVLPRRITHDLERSLGEALEVLDASRSKAA